MLRRFDSLSGSLASDLVFCVNVLYVVCAIVMWCSLVLSRDGCECVGENEEDFVKVVTEVYVAGIIGSRFFFHLLVLLNFSKSRTAFGIFLLLM